MIQGHLSCGDTSVSGLSSQLLLYMDMFSDLHFGAYNKTMIREHLIPHNFVFVHHITMYQYLCVSSYHNLYCYHAYSAIVTILTLITFISSDVVVTLIQGNYMEGHLPSWIYILRTVLELLLFPGLYQYHRCKALWVIQAWYSSVWKDMQ